MKKYFSRIELMLNQDINFFDKYTVLVVGIGGVGSHTCEALVRSGIKNLIIVDYDDIDESNLNRQIMTNIKNIGNKKTNELKKHLSLINDELNIKIIDLKITKENLNELDKYKFDFVIDAIDLVTHKMELINYCLKKDIYIISALGTGNKIDPTMIKVSDIYKTKNCPLARTIRREAKKRKFNKFDVVYSEELSTKNTKESSNRNVPGSMIFVPGAVGYTLASQIIKKILYIESN